MRKTAHLALSVLAVAVLGVSAARAQSAPAKQQKSPAAKSGSTTHRAKSIRKSKKRERGQKAPTPERISEIQQALGKDGSFNGSPNGKWDASTVEAMKKFQESHGLNPTGKLDAKTLQQLGLGSQTAGVAPPMPAISSSSLQKTPSSQTAHRQQ